MTQRQITPGTMDIRAWSFEHVVTCDGTELCVRCAELLKYGEDDFTPIFASDEWDRSSVCDNCGNESTLHTIIDCRE